MPGANIKRVNTPADEDHHHDGDELHDMESFFAGFRNTFGVFPPEIDRDNDCESRSDYARCAFREMTFGKVEILEEFIEEAAEILASGDAADRAGKNVIEHQGGDGEFGKATTEGLLDGAIDAPADEHAAAFDVHRADRVREDHDGKDEPGSGLADVALGFATGIVGGGSKVVEDDCSSLPEGNEGEERGGGDYDARNCVATAAIGNRAIGNRTHEMGSSDLPVVSRPADLNARKFRRGSLVRDQQSRIRK